MTTERQAAKADAKDVDLSAAERAADLWLAMALRKLSRDDDVVRQVRQRIFVKGQMATVSSVLTALADVIERDTPPDGQATGRWAVQPPATPEDVSRVGRPSDDGDATGGGPYTPGSVIEEFGGED